MDENQRDSVEENGVPYVSNHFFKKINKYCNFT